MDEQTPRSKSPNQTNNSPKTTEAGCRAASGSRILGQDVRWMSRQPALNPQTKPTTPPKPARQDAEPLKAPESSVRMTDG